MKKMLKKRIRKMNYIKMMHRNKQRGLNYHEKGGSERT